LKGQTEQTDSALSMMNIGKAVNKINQSVHTHDSLLIENEVSSLSMTKLPELNDPKILCKRKISSIGRSYNINYDKINVKNKNHALSQLTDSVIEEFGATGSKAQVSY
jgi:hypothetical protein